METSFDRQTPPLGGGGRGLAGELGTDALTTTKMMREGNQWRSR